jgi:predicted pyridoxine 5'-phosphate oxidase superfamily flavin-nucleotide-binding protein
MTKKARNHELTDDAAVAAHYGEPSVLARYKTMTRLDKYARQFIACAPFMVMATASADGAVGALGGELYLTHL